MKLVSRGTSQNQNKCFYQLLLDGIICTYAAKGTPNGKPGFLHPALRAISNTLTTGSESQILNDIQVTSVLPMKCSHTHLTRQIHYSNNTKQIDFCCLVFVRDNVSDNTVHNGDS